MIVNFDVIMRHMQERHPDVKKWDNDVIGSASGEVISIRCQICGDELINDSQTHGENGGGGATAQSEAEVASKS